MHYGPLFLSYDFIRLTVTMTKLTILSFRYSRKIVFLAIFTKFLNFQKVWAQLPANVDSISILPTQIIEDALRSQEQKEEELQKKIEPKIDVLTPDFKKEIPTQLPIETPCFEIKEILFIENAQPFLLWLPSQVKPFLKQCAGAEGINRIVEYLNASLMDEGFVTSKVSVFEQNLKYGKLFLKVHIGRVAEIKMIKKGDPLKQSDKNFGTWKNAFPVQADDVFNIRYLEQGIEQMRRLPSQKITTQIEPGASPNSSIIYIEREESGYFQRLRFGTSVDNAGNNIMGRTQTSSYLALDNPFGLNDIISASFMSNAENPTEYRNSQSFSMHYSIPYKYQTFSIGNSYSRYAQNVNLTTSSLLSKGNSNKTEAKWELTMLRTSSSKWGIYASISARQANSYLNEIEVLVQGTKTTNLEAGISYKKLIGKASLDATLGYRLGLGILGADNDYDPSKFNNVTLRPYIFSAKGGYNHLFSLGRHVFQFSSKGRFQYTAQKTTTTDQFSIGNRYSVRGFDGDKILIAESGYYIRNDLAVPIKSLPSWLTMMGYIGLDYGHVFGPSAGYLVGQDLAGVALGTQGKFYFLQFDLALSAPIYKASSFNTSYIAPYLSVSCVL